MDKENNVSTRVERHQISKNHELYSICDDLCFKSKNLYNYANYLIRQTFIITSKLKEGKEISQEQQEFLNAINQKVDDFNNARLKTLIKKQSKGKSLDKTFKPLKYFDENSKYLGYNFLEFLCSDGNDYKVMMAQSAQQTLKLLDKNWKSFFESIKDWKVNPSKYTGRPKLPNYKNKNGRYNAIFTNQNCKIIDDYVQFPKCFNSYKLKTNVKSSLQQVRILPRNNHVVIEVVYNVRISNLKEDNGRYYSIDIGLDNFATVVNNFGETPFVINGKGLKSINKYYNKKLSHYREIAKRMNGLDYTHKMNKLTMKRNNLITDYIHKASKYIIDCAVQSGVFVIVIGNNKDWKRESKMSKKVNQSFVGIPHQEFIKKLQYKAENVGIKVILVEESYTSGTSFLDNEMPVKENYDKSRRKYRGLFISNEGIKINADCNGAYQIMKKVFKDAYADLIEDVGLHPIRVNVA